MIQVNWAFNVPNFHDHLARHNKHGHHGHKDDDVPSIRIFRGPLVGEIGDNDKRGCGDDKDNSLSVIPPGKLARDITISDHGDGHPHGHGHGHGHGHYKNEHFHDDGNDTIARAEAGFGESFVQTGFVDIDVGLYTIVFCNADEGDGPGGITRTTQPFAPTGEKFGTWIFTASYKDYLVRSTVGNIGIQAVVRQVPGTDGAAGGALVSHQHQFQRQPCVHRVLGAGRNYLEPARQRPRRY